MSQKFSEINKVNNVYSPAVGSSGVAAAPGTALYETDIVNLKLYKNCTFIATIGATVAATLWNFKVMSCNSATHTGITIPIAFNYQLQGSTSAASYGAGSDTPEGLTAGTSDGINTTVAGYVGGTIIFEVDPAVVLAAGSGYEHVKLYWTATTAADAPRALSIVAILSEPRYPQAILNSAID
jgi:hypothetical protein